MNIEFAAILLSFVWFIVWFIILSSMGESKILIYILIVLLMFSLPVILLFLKIYGVW